MSGAVFSGIYPVEKKKTEWAMGTFLGSYLQDVGDTEMPGIAYGWEQVEIDYARRTMHDVGVFLLSGGGGEFYRSSRERFARDCYRYSHGERENFEGAMLVDKVYPAPTPPPT